MRFSKIQSCLAALALASLGACTGLRDADPCSGAVRAIHEIQGAGAASSLEGKRAAIRGVVVGDFQRRDQLSGFFLQEAASDGDPRTSEGIFVHAPRVEDVSDGDLVQVEGRVKEYDGLTELTDVEEVAVCDTGRMPSPEPLSLAEVDDLEPYEGMLVALTGELTVVGSHELGLHGQLLLASGRPFKRSGTEGVKLLLDDGSGIEQPPELAHLGQSRTRRIGDTVSDVVGIISETEDGHVLHPTAPPRFEAANPRDAEPPDVGGTVSVAGFNLLNYFITFGERGASNGEELERQRAKHLAAITGMDADIVALSELENHDGAIRDLVEVLNDAAGEDAWAAVPDPTGGYGDDPIRVGLIYRREAVRAVGEPKIDRDSAFKRPPLAQTFEVDGERFTVVVNHFKSKSCRHAKGKEEDAGDGQGCWNPFRVRQARRLLEFVDQLKAESGDPDVLVVGDLNAYGGEDPIRALTEGGLIDQVEAHVPAAERYSYVYRGTSGYLDHALTTKSLDSRVSGVAIWHINSDEPPLLDYNTEHGHPELYQPDPYRSSDHDPVLIGLDL